jgi:hypothetical protein
MRALPTGTVTFLFTDIEGGTKLLQRLGPEYAAHSGVEVDNHRETGDEPSAPYIPDIPAHVRWDARFPLCAEARARWRVRRNECVVGLPHCRTGGRYCWAHSYSASVRSLE